MRKDTVTAANKQLPNKSLFSHDRGPPESSSHTDRSGGGRNCTQSQTTTAPERNLSVKHHLQQEQRQFLHTQIGEGKKLVQELTVSVYRFLCFEKNHHIVIEFI